MKINPNEPTERLGESCPIQGATRLAPRTTFTNADLPVACLPLWNTHYIPLLVDWTGTLPNPWKYYNIDVPGNLQSRWDATYPALATRILPKEAIFVRVCIVIF